MGEARAMRKDVTLTVNAWAGPLPTVGTYLMAARGRTAYEILEFRPARSGARTVGRFRCRRLERTEVPEGATVMGGQWAQR